MTKAWVLGGGLSGIAIGHELKKKGYKVTVFEKEEEIGGLCQTYKHGNINHEFGPHILYWKTEEQERWWKRFTSNKLREYYVRVSIDGKVRPFEEMYDFPITNANLKRLGVAYKSGGADYSNFENYMISQIGNRAYDAFVKNYNIKQWGINPSEMSAEWAHTRPLTIQKQSPPLMFGKKKAGHPLTYKVFFDNLARGLRIKTACKIEKIVVENNIVTEIKYSRDYNTRKAVKERIYIAPGDLVINTLPLDWIMKDIIEDNIELGWRGIMKMFIGLEGAKLPTYSTTFPNNYDFTRIVDYPKQSGQRSKDRTLISFAFPYNSREDMKFLPVKAWEDQVMKFIGEELEATIYTETKYWNSRFVYPISSKENIDNVDRLFKEVAKIDNMFTIGRLGLYAYISMARATEMCEQLANEIEERTTPELKYDLYKELRSDLW